jgi:hypothetical protein
MGRLASFDETARLGDPRGTFSLRTRPVRAAALARPISRLASVFRVLKERHILRVGAPRRTRGLAITPVVATPYQNDPSARASRSTTFCQRGSAAILDALFCFWFANAMEFALIGDRL